MMKSKHFHTHKKKTCPIYDGQVLKFISPKCKNVEDEEYFVSKKF